MDIVARRKPNSIRFLDAYNRTDKALHVRFGFKPSMPFADVVHRAASVNSVVRKYEDDLIDFSRLRNAIVHRSDSTMTIAEPHDNVTVKFEHIASVLAMPPLSSSIAHKPFVVTADTPLKNAIAVMTERDFSNLPVVDDGKIIDILTNKSVVCYVAKHIGGVDPALDVAVVRDVLSDGKSYFKLLPDCPVDEILTAFENNRKLTMVILTAGGTADGDILGVITVGDLAAISKLLEGY